MIEFLIQLLGPPVLVIQEKIGHPILLSQTTLPNQAASAENSGNGMLNQVSWCRVMECRSPRNADAHPRSKQTARRPKPLTRPLPGTAVRPPLLPIKLIKGTIVRSPRRRTANRPPLLLKIGGPMLRPRCLLRNGRNRASRTRRPSRKCKIFQWKRCGLCGGNFASELCREQRKDTLQTFVVKCILKSYAKLQRSHLWQLQ